MCIERLIIYVMSPVVFMITSYDSFGNSNVCHIMTHTYILPIDLQYILIIQYMTVSDLLSTCSINFILLTSYN